MTQAPAAEPTPSAPPGGPFRRFLRWLGRRPALLLLAAFLITAPFITPYLRGDGVGYYAWIASIATDGDVDFVDEYRQGDPSFKLGWFNEDGTVQSKQLLDNGLVLNQWNTGAAVTWIPFYATGTAASAALGSAGEPGFTAPTLWFVGFGTALMSFLSLLIGFRLVRGPFGTWPSVLAVIAVWLASSLPIYMYFLSFYPFGVGAFVGGLLLLAWHRTSGWAFRRWLLLGILGGFVTSVHPIAITWVVLPFAGLVWLDDGTRRERVRALAPFVLGGVIGYLPQMILKFAVFGSPLASGYYSDWNFLTPPVFKELFSADHGLISWTPIVLVALIGLLFVRRRDRRLGDGVLLVFAAMLYMAAAYTTDEVSSYGNRFFVVFSPGFVIGVAGALAWVWERRRHAWRWVATAGIALLIVWNVLFMFQWGWGLVPKRGPVDWGTVVSQQFTTAPREMVRAFKLVLTDRAELLRIVQENDLRNFEEGDL